MIWDDIIEPFFALIHNVADFFYAIQYIFSNLANVFVIIFSPINFAFNFIKGFFDGINVPPPETAISWAFDSGILAIFNTIPYWSVLMFGVGAGLSILVLIFVVSQLMKL
ncbi:MAG: hypothetical protein MUP69_05655 [Candidatus Atribacteria bacterium]|nr:hypothetical protein [Candidatus Atribacteria bacterium]